MAINIYISLSKYILKDLSYRTNLPITLIERKLNGLLVYHYKFISTSHLLYSPLKMAFHKG